MRWPALVVVWGLMACGGTEPTESATAHTEGHAGLFSRDNLVAWCIVPFDAAKRGPSERAAMLQRLGLRGLVYDYRDEHIPTFDAEIAALRERDIELAGWWCGGVDPHNPLEGSVGLALETLRRNKASSDLWVLIEEGPLEGLSQADKVALTADAIEAVAAEAETIGSRVGLYNHGGWYGEPSNQLEILEQLTAENVGLVYNFHHGHEHFEQLQEVFPRMVPHLLCVNLNGMTLGGEKILPLGAGERDRKMLRIVRESGYRGPIGILDHRPEIDAETALLANLEGLAELVTDQP